MHARVAGGDEGELRRREDVGGQRDDAAVVEHEGERLAQREQPPEQRGLPPLAEHGARAGSADAPSRGSAGHQPGRWVGGPRSSRVRMAALTGRPIS